MNDRARAAAILRQARDLLADRLTKQILENREQLLDDALGASYGGEIDGLYEQLGMRLAHVSAMLAALPVADEGPTSIVAVAAAPASAVSVELGAHVAFDEAATSVELMPADGPTPPRGPAEPPLARFVRQIEAGELAEAAETLRVLCDLPIERAAVCAALFRDRLAGDPQLSAQVLVLAGELAQGSHSALRRLAECLGLEGPEARGALKALEARDRG